MSSSQADDNVPTDEETEVQFSHVRAARKSSGSDLTSCLSESKVLSLTSQITSDSNNLHILPRAL